MTVNVLIKHSTLYAFYIIEEKIGILSVNYSTDFLYEGNFIHRH